MSSHFRGTLERGLAVNDGHRYGALICWRRTGSLQNSGRAFRSHAVNDYRFEALPGEILDRGINVAAVFKPALKFAPNAAKHPNNLVIATKQHHFQAGF